MHLLVTRPEPDSIKLVGLLRKRGHEALAAPLTTFAPLRLDPDALEGVTGLIATSRNALRALVGSDALESARSLTVFAVGTATAEEARRMGFARVVKGPGTAADLVPLIASLVDPAEDILLHLAGEHLAFDLPSELGTVGIRVESRTVYRMDPVAALPASVVRAIATGAIDAVMLMSPRAASIWARLAVRHDLVGALRRVWHLCISDAVAARLAPLGATQVDVARRPTLEEMLALVDRTAAR
jgi:uroporphyrinogen-III synthase